MRRIALGNWWTNPKTGEIYTLKEACPHADTLSAETREELEEFLAIKAEKRRIQKIFLAKKFAQEEKARKLALTK